MKQLATVILSLVLLTTAACGPTQGERLPSTERASAQTPGARKIVTVAITSNVGSMGLMGTTGTTAGGFQHLNEVHSIGLVTADTMVSRPIPRLLTKLPSIDDGSIAILDDGRMRVVYGLRNDVTWHDGTAFTAHDLVFTLEVMSTPGLPISSGSRRALKQIQSIEVVDDHTAVIFFGSPYYRANALDLEALWPQPRHLLADPLRRYKASQNGEDFLGVPYWTSEYVHLGPFRLTSFRPDEEFVFEAYDQYFLGRPKLDLIRVRVFGDQNPLFAAVLAGQVDMVLGNTVVSDAGIQLKERWSDGRVQVNRGSTWLLIPQWRPGIQSEPANLDPRVRAALYVALDREALAEALQGGNRDLAVQSLLPPEHEHYDATRAGLRQYSYDPARAKAMLSEAGWVAGPDGALINSSDGRRFRTAVWSPPRSENAIAVVADYWRRLGLEVDEYTKSAPENRDREFRVQYPGWDYTSRTSDDRILVLMEGPAASAENRWAGNRGGYEDPRAQRLIDAYRSSISGRDQLQAMQAVSDFVDRELPFLSLYYAADYLAVRKGIQALDDAAGTGGYGTYTRNSHLWEVR